MAWRKRFNISRWPACEPCEKLKRAIFIPACKSETNTSTCAVAGPSVQMIFVLRAFESADVCGGLDDEVDEEDVLDVGEVLADVPVAAAFKLAWVVEFKPPEKDGPRERELKPRPVEPNEPIIFEPTPPPPPPPAPPNIPCVIINGDSCDIILGIRLLGVPTETNAGDDAPTGVPPR